MIIKEEELLKSQESELQKQKVQLEEKRLELEKEKAQQTLFSPEEIYKPQQQGLSFDE